MRNTSLTVTRKPKVEKAAEKLLGRHLGKGDWFRALPDGDLYVFLGETQHTRGLYNQPFSEFNCVNLLTGGTGIAPLEHSVIRVKDASIVINEEESYR